MVIWWQQQHFCDVILLFAYVSIILQWCFCDDGGAPFIVFIAVGIFIVVVCVGVVGCGGVVVCGGVVGCGGVVVCGEEGGGGLLQAVGGWCLYHDGVVLVLFIKFKSVVKMPIIFMIKTIAEAIFTIIIITSFNIIIIFFFFFFTISLDVLQAVRR